MYERMLNRPKPHPHLLLHKRNNLLLNLRQLLNRKRNRLLLLVKTSVNH